MTDKKPSEPALRAASKIVMQLGWLEDDRKVIIHAEGLAEPILRRLAEIIDAEMQAIAEPPAPAAAAGVTIWFCDTCLECGAVEHDPHIDVMGGLYVVGDHHRERSPSCDTGLRKVRILAHAEQDLKQMRVVAIERQPPPGEQPALRDGQCHWCLMPTESWAGNPYKWPLLFAYNSDGVVLFHHVGCVIHRLSDWEKEMDRVKQEMLSRGAPTDEREIGQRYLEWVRHFDHNAKIEPEAAFTAGWKAREGQR